MLGATSQWTLAVSAYQRWKTQKIPSLGHLAALLRSGESWRRSLEERCNCEVGVDGLMSLVVSVIRLLGCRTVEVWTTCSASTCLANIDRQIEYDRILYYKCKTFFSHTLVGSRSFSRTLFQKASQNSPKEHLGSLSVETCQSFFIPFTGYPLGWSSRFPSVDQWSYPGICLFSEFFGDFSCKSSLNHQ